MSSDQEQEYFSDGITEEIINALAKINGLKVTSRTSSFHFKGKNIPINEIAQQLGVATILEGSVRLGGNKMRITAQLIQAEDDFHYWSETWDRNLENIFEIQDEISLEIADKLREQMGHFELQDHLVTKQTDSISAYEFYLKGRFHFRKWEPEQAKIAIDYYEKALEYDAKHAETLFGMADAYSFLATTGYLSQKEGWGKSAQLIAQGLEINPNLAEGHYQKANLDFFIQSDLKASYQSALHANKLNPGFPEAYHHLIFLNAISGNLDEAQKFLKSVLAFDPLSLETNFFEGFYEYHCSEYTKALAAINRSLELNPMAVPSIVLKCFCYLLLNQPEMALEVVESIPKEVQPADQLGVKALAAIMLKDDETAEQLIAELKELSKNPTGFREYSFLLFIYIALNDFHRAFEWTEEAFEIKTPFIFLHYGDPLAHKLKEDQRYTTWHKKIFPSFKSLEKNTKKQLIEEDQIEKHKTTLLDYMRQEEAYLSPNLSLKQLSQDINIHPNQLSWLLNEVLQNNFNDFVNRYRVETFKSRVKDAKFAHLSLIGLAYECGFNSKTVFNTYFKKQTGMTPKEYQSSLS